jgi:hypothetical protein
MAEAAPTAVVKSDKIPLSFQLGEKLIDAATRSAATFASFANCIAQAHRMTQAACTEPFG